MLQLSRSCTVRGEGDETDVVTREFYRQSGLRTYWSIMRRTAFARSRHEDGMGGPMPRISSTSYKRAAKTIVVAVLTAVAVCVGPPVPARASSIDVECAGSFSRSFSPAVTTTSQTVTTTEA